VYEGAPTPVTAFLSTGSKAAAFASFSRVFILTFAATPFALSAGVLHTLQSAATDALVVMAILTMTIGNLVAIVQSNIKRMLAYSSIAHAGYALIGIVAGDWRAVAFYLLSYVLINIGAFGVIELIARRGDKRVEISDYAGIGFQSLGLSSALSLFLLSLAGIPLTGGFVAKLLVFKSAWAGGFHALVVIAVINSAISWYYYLRVIVAMFFAEPAAGFKTPRVARSMAAAIMLALLGTLYLGILPGIESIDNHVSRSVRAVKAEDIAAEVTQQLGALSIPAIYRDKIRPQRTRQYELRSTAKKSPVEILHTLLGIELKVGNRRLLCPDLATARYLSVFARLGCSIIAVPYDITQISRIADELESSWHRMLLLIDHWTDGRSERLRALVRQRLISEARAAIDSLGPGSRFPEFHQPKRQPPKR
jgi:hypothetical protein